MVFPKQLTHQTLMKLDKYATDKDKERLTYTGIPTVQNSLNVHLLFNKFKTLSYIDYQLAMLVQK